MLITQSCLTLCDPMDYSPPGFSVYGILQARILEWITMPSFRVSFRPRDWTLHCRWTLYHLSHNTILLILKCRICHLWFLHVMPIIYFWQCLCPIWFFYQLRKNFTQTMRGVFFFRPFFSNALQSYPNFLVDLFIFGAGEVFLFIKQNRKKMSFFCGCCYCSFSFSYNF